MKTIEGVTKKVLSAGNPTPADKAEKTSQSEIKVNDVSVAQIYKKRSTYWGFLLYKESAPKNYLEILKSFQVDFCLSPLHDKDVWTQQDEQDNPEHIAGTPKKEHIHGIFRFQSMKSFSQVKELTDKLNAPFPIRIISISKSVQYFVHKNDPEKHQYDRKDIVDYCFGVDDYFITQPTIAEKIQYLDDMRIWVRKNSVVRFSDLMDEAMGNRLDTWGRLFTDSPRWSIERYINGCWQEKEAKKKSQFYFGEYDENEKENE